jgi:hypothetical protein
MPASICQHKNFYFGHNLWFLDGFGISVTMTNIIGCCFFRKKRISECETRGIFSAAAKTNLNRADLENSIVVFAEFKFHDQLPTLHRISGFFYKALNLPFSSPNI